MDSRLLTERVLQFYLIKAEVLLRRHEGYTKTWMRISNRKKECSSGWLPYAVVA